MTNPVKFIIKSLPGIRDVVAQRDNLLIERDKLAAQRDELVSKQNDLTIERDKLASQRDNLIRDFLARLKKLTSERDTLVTERDNLAAQSGKFISERDSLVFERDKLISERDKAVSELNKLRPWNKMQIINYLAAVNGYCHYLELCTAFTGHFYRELDRRLFVTCRRLMYKCNAEFEDGLEIDFRSPDFNIDECLSQLVKTEVGPDIVLVDPWHEYDTSFRDLAKAFELVPPGGSLVVHDCLPPSLSAASPEYVPGEWCGVTYKAYIDFVSGRSDLEFKTVNMDYGCGVIRKAVPTHPTRPMGPSMSRNGSPQTGSIQAR